MIVCDVDADRTSTFAAPGGHVVALCPTGRRLAFHAGQRDEVAVLDLKTGKHLRLEATAGWHPLSHLVQFSPDGRWIAAVEQPPVSLTPNASVAFWDAQSGRRALRVRGEWFALGRDDRAVVAQGATLRRVDLTSKSEEAVVPTDEVTAESWFGLRLSDDGRRLAAMGPDLQLWVFSVNGDRPPCRVALHGTPSDWVFRGRDVVRTIGRTSLDDCDLTQAGRQWFAGYSPAAAHDAGGTRVAVPSLGEKAGSRQEVNVFGADGKVTFGAGGPPVSRGPAVARRVRQDRRLGGGLLALPRPARPRRRRRRPAIDARLVRLAVAAHGRPAGRHPGRVGAELPFRAL